MMAVPAEAGDRLRKCVLLLSSDQDGEVIAAARAIDRTLSSMGMDWHDLADAVAGPALPAPEDNVERFLSSLDTIATRPADREWISRLSRFYARRGFLTGKQMAVLADIAGRCCHAA